MKTRKTRSAMSRIIPDSDFKLDDQNMEEAEELDGNMSNSGEDKQALMKTVMEHDDADIDDGKFVNEMADRNISSFQPDMLMAQMVQNYKNAEKINGPSMIREATGMSNEKIERNIRLPEFQKELKSRLSAKAREMEDKGIINRRGEILDTGRALGTLQMFAAEIDRIEATGITGERFHQKEDRFGMKSDSRPYRKGDSFKDLAWKQIIKKTARRGHTNITRDDLVTHTRQSKGEICLIYAIDASGSMRGNKIKMAKRAGVAMCYKATENNDATGLIIFSDKIQTQVSPTKEFFPLLTAMSEIKAEKQTDIAFAIEKSIEMFPDKNITKHLLFLTDAQTTVGDDPKKLCLETASKAAALGITISIIGLEMDKDSVEFTQELTAITGGRLYVVDSTDGLEALVLRDYEQFAH